MRTLSIYKCLFLLACTTTFFSCKKSVEESMDTFKGSEVSMGNGKANSLFGTNKSGVPREIGIELTAEAFTGLTQDPN